MNNEQEMDNSFDNCEINQITHLTILRTRKEVLMTQSGMEVERKGYIRYIQLNMPFPHCPYPVLH